jgi:hypothetical protein
MAFHPLAASRRTGGKPAKVLFRATVCLFQQTLRQEPTRYNWVCIRLDVGNGCLCVDKTY